ncbi:MAG: hypothetical protein KGI29_01035 [Pseudomonadota bacterium]|nr:hypothetical protein [Pseudomonadota bacterium]MDE3037045.1 hypothetical protein [Pseudomonadota bacterium]
MKRDVILMMLCGTAVAGCTPSTGVVQGAAIYGAASAVSDPPPDASTAVKNVAKDVQSNTAEALNHVNNLGTAAKEGIYHGMDSFADWMRPPPPPPPPKVIASSYCYRTYQDILCYRQPMPGWEYRLVGYQGTYAAPPPPAFMQPLPVQAAMANSSSARVADAKPVFTDMPPPENEVTKPDDTGTADPTHEMLPNPALVPQL